MTDYVDDIKGYVSNVNIAAVDGIVKHLGIALKSNDASLVACSDPAERNRIRDGFMAKKIGASASDADAEILAVCEQMSATRNKSRVTFYYLLADRAGKLGLFD